MRSPWAAGGFGMMAGEEMRAADADLAVEGERIKRREVERDLETFDRRVRIAAIDVDPAAAAPGPGRPAVSRERPRDHLRCGVLLAEQSQRIAKHSKRGRIAGERHRPPCQFDAALPLLQRLRREMV